jgi:hypothetical protein
MASFNPWLFVAFLAASAVCVTHVVLGGRLVARPLLASDLRPHAKFTAYYCWHLVSAALALMAAGLAWGAFAAEAREAAVGATALAGAFMGVNVAQNLTMRLSFARHPQGAFFLVVTALGIVGLVNG